MIKKTSSFYFVVSGNKMLSYNKSLRPVAHYELIDDILYVVQLNMSYTEIENFTKFRVNEFNSLTGENLKLKFEFQKEVN